MCGLVSLPAATPVVGPVTYLVLRANAGSKSSLLQVVPKSKHANISNQRRFRLTDATIRSSPDWNKDKPMLTLCCSRKRRRSPTPTAKTGCQVYLARSGQGSPPLSWAGASVSFSVLVKAILKSRNAHRTFPSSLAISPCQEFTAQGCTATDDLQSTPFVTRARSQGAWRSHARPSVSVVTKTGVAMPVVDPPR